MALQFYNTLSRAVEEFEPLEAGHVRMYTCGPTVYNYAHIGNFRAYVFEDLLRRVLKFKGYRVTQVMNLTDVDDKTIRNSIEKKLPLAEYTALYKQAFFDDIRALNIEPAEHYPAATDHIVEMVNLIKNLLGREYAYRSDDGCIYFSIEKFEDYGKLAHLDMQGLKAGARVAQDEYEKESAADFALWKAWDEKDGDVKWDSPWGPGRPGWHIECSAMSMKYLGDSFDIHTGGVDNIFPHHEDEIAQSEAATGKPFAKYWLHCAHLVVDGKKMSKSLRNFFTLRDLFEKGYSGREIRYELLATHYRQSLNFSFTALDAARSALKRLDEYQERLKDYAGEAPATPELPRWARKEARCFEAALENDLNTAEALGALFEAVSLGNKSMDDKSLSPGEAQMVRRLLGQWDAVLGFLSRPADVVPEEIKQLLEQRQAARQAKNWAESDRVRAQLAERGWLVKDTPKGQVAQKA